MDTKTIDPRQVRQSAIAGTWYPGSPETLKQTVDDFLAQATHYETHDELIALISPHAGYPYSGQTAAHAYRQLQGLQYDTIVLLGPSHRGDYGTVVISSKKYYWTPLGAIELDQEFIRGLSERIDIQRVTRDQEHSLEIQLPFLQRMLDGFRIVPLMMSHPFYIVGESALGPCEQLSAALAELANSRRVLFVASSDLSHLEDYVAVQEFDARTEELVRALDIPSLVDFMWQGRQCRACGDVSIVTELLAAKALGANRVRVLHRTNSGDVTGECEHSDYVVGYMAAAVYKSKE